MKSRIPLFLIGAAALAACDLDFTEPVSPADYLVTVRFTDSTFTSASIEAFLSPGYDATGAERTIPNDTITVWNHTLSPLAIDEGVRRYETTITTDPRSLASPVISTSPPDVTGVGTAPALTLNLVWREGPQSMDVPRGADVVLQIANVEDLVAQGVDGVVWRLSVALQGGQAIFRTAALGLPPAEVTVPAVVIAETDAPVLEASMEISYTTRSEGPCFACPSYAAELRVLAELHWSLLPVGP